MMPTTPEGQTAGAPPVTIDAVVALLRDDRMRGFRIEVETDSLVEADQAQERADVTAFVQAIGGFFKEFGPIVAQMPPLAPMASQLLLVAVRRFKVGAQLEEVIEKSMEQVEERLNNPAPPQPDPTEQAKIAITQKKGEAEIAKAQLSIEEAKAKMAGEAQLREQAARHAENEDNRKAALHELDKQAAIVAHRHDMETKQLERAFAQQTHEAGLEKARHETELKDRSAEHEAGLKAKSAEHDASLKKETTSHDMAIKEKQAKQPKNEGSKDSSETKAKLEKMIAEISKAITSKKKIIRGDKGEIVGIESSEK